LHFFDNFNPKLNFAKMNSSNRNSFFRKLILLLICLAPLMAIAQEEKPKEKGAPATSRAQRKKAKAKWKEDRRLERDEKKAIKDYHKRIQTKETRKRMKAERKKGDKLRENKKEFFLFRKWRHRQHPH
jgi:hypothetical protein